MAEAGNRIERQVDVLQQVLPLLLELKNMVQRALYVRRLSEKLGIAESWVLAELQKVTAHPSRTGGEVRFQGSLTDGSAKKADDRRLLHLFVHNPSAIEQFIEKNLKTLLSDPSVLRILDLMVNDYQKEGELVPDRVIESLNGDPASDILREVMLSPPIYRPDEVDQALKEFEDRVHRMRISESKRKALGNIEEANKIPKLIKKRWG
jgi:hypothetical protein